MAQQARRRAAATKTKEEEEDVRPISEEEQEAEITALRKKAAADKATGRTYLDALVAVCLFVFLRQIYRYINESVPAPLVLITALQAALVPLSLSPERLPAALGPLAATYHPTLVLVQLLLFGGSFFLQIGKVPLTELVRAALPELLAFSVEMQRRAERQNEAALDKLEKLKYPLKGA